MSKFAFGPPRFRARLLFAMCLCSAIFAGCGPAQKPVGTVKGSVTLDGQPYADAAIVFMSLKSGQAASVDIQPGGMFQLPAPLPVDSYTVYLAPKAPVESDQPKPITIDKSVPEKYWSEASSDVKIEVQEGENDVRVELKK